MPRFLFITGTPPFPLTSGGAQRTNLIYRSLAALGHVDLLLVKNGEDPNVLQTLRHDFGLISSVEPTPPGQRGPWRMIRPLIPSARFVDRLAHNIDNRMKDYDPDNRVSVMVQLAFRRHRYDAIVGRALRQTCNADAFGRVPVVVDIDDLDSERYRSRLSVPGLPWWKKVVLQRHLRGAERGLTRVLHRCTHLWLANNLDTPLVKHRSLSILQNIPYHTPIEPPRSVDSDLLVTVGNWGWQANVDGVEHFLRACWPHIRRTCPAARYTLVGGGMSDSLRRSWRRIDGVEVIGLVPDITEAYASAALVVAPIYHGGGTNIKVLEALAFGRAVVCTKHAQRGYEHVLKDADALCVADDDRALATACVALLHDARRRDTMAERGRALVLKHFSFDAFAGEVRQTIERVLDRSNALYGRLPSQTKTISQSAGAISRPSNTN